MRDISDLRQRQALPLSAKVLMTQNRIREWYQHFDGDVFVSFSGGKDSTVLAHLVRDLYPDVPLVFSNTGLEYPEIQSFAREMGAIFVRPKMIFSEVISRYGYPIIGKEVSECIYYARKIIYSASDKTAVSTAHKRLDITGKRTFQRFERGAQQEVYQSDTEKSLYNKEKYLPLCCDTQFVISAKCCSVMKKSPIHIWQRKNKMFPILGTLAEESRLRTQAWIKHGCNAFEGSKLSSQPMSFWTEQDVLQYIKQNNIKIASVYGDVISFSVDKDGYEYESLPGIGCDLKCSGCSRTGCIFCGYGAHLEKGETRFQRLAKTHPKQYEYCIGGGQWVDNPAYDPTAPEYDGTWKNWNPKKIWVPSKKGLGMKKVFDDCNSIYGKDFIRYE